MKVSKCKLKKSYSNKLGSPEQVVHKIIPVTPPPPMYTQPVGQTIGKINLFRNSIPKPDIADFHLQA